jgi:hypothetical protein
MTPQDKANELITKMQLDWGCNCCHNDWAKECALVAVDEILSEYWSHNTERRDWWKQVKQAIEKL